MAAAGTADSSASGGWSFGGASKHVLLSPESLSGFNHLDQARASKLHREARALVNRYANADPGATEHGVLADLAAGWEDWKLYIATRTNAQQLVGSGVVAFTAEFIEGVRDPNRGGRLRLDFVLRHSDGGYVRIHPGRKQKDDAISRYFVRSTSNHAAQEWRMPGADGIFTPDRAAIVPLTDRLGKAAVWEAVQRLGLACGDVRDITDGRDLRWWLWVCNLGRHTTRVIGDGVQRAQVRMNGKKAVFTFSRSDGTECIVMLSSERRTWVEEGINLQGME